MIGNGPGYTYAWAYEVSVHNMVLLMMAEHGLLGLLLYVLFLVGLFRFRWPYGLWAGGVTLGVTPFNHNLFDLPCYGLIYVLYWLVSTEPDQSWLVIEGAKRRLRRIGGPTIPVEDRGVRGAALDGSGV